jgi:hypothetical protein
MSVKDSKRPAEQCTLPDGLGEDLALILGRSELLREILFDNRDARKHLVLIQIAARHMADRIEMHQCESNAEECDRENTAI